MPRRKKARQNKRANPKLAKAKKRNGANVSNIDWNNSAKRKSVSPKVEAHKLDITPVNKSKVLQRTKSLKSSNSGYVCTNLSYIFHENDDPHHENGMIKNSERICETPKIGYIVLPEQMNYNTQANQESNLSIYAISPIYCTGKQQHLGGKCNNDDAEARQMFYENIHPNKLGTKINYNDINRQYKEAKEKCNGKEFMVNLKDKSTINKLLNKRDVAVQTVDATDMLDKSVFTNESSNCRNNCSDKSETFLHKISGNVIGKMKNFYRRHPARWFQGFLAVCGWLVASNQKLDSNNETRNLCHCSDYDKKLDEVLAKLNRAICQSNESQSTLERNAHLLQNLRCKSDEIDVNVRRVESCLNELGRVQKQQQHLQQQSQLAQVFSPIGGTFPLYTPIAHMGPPGKPPPPPPLPTVPLHNSTPINAVFVSNGQHRPHETPVFRPIINAETLRQVQLRQVPNKPWLLPR